MGGNQDMETKISLNEAMGLLHDGMEKIAFDVVKFQTMVGDLVRMAGSSGDEAVIERAQAIDSMAQALFRLARSTQAIGTALRHNHTGDEALALDGVTLHDLQHAAQNSASPSGDVDLF
jgi:hypothetical protein